MIFNHLLATVLIGLAFLNRWCSAAESGTAGIRKQTCKLIAEDHLACASLGTVRSLLGHASPDVTFAIYAHGIPTEERRAVENVEKLVFGPKWIQVLEGFGKR